MSARRSRSRLRPVVAAAVLATAICASTTSATRVEGAAVIATNATGRWTTAGGPTRVEGSLARIESDLARAKHGYPWKRRLPSARRFARRRAGDVSFAIVGERGNRRGLRPRREFESASVVKLMLMVSYLRRPSIRQRRLRSADRALLGPMITRSDNGAASAVYAIVGSNGLRRLARRAKMRDFHPNVVWGLTGIAAADQAPLLFRLRRYLPKRHRRYAFHLLSTIVSSQRWGIPPARPRGWRPFFKGGWTPASGGWNVHQVALLRRGGRRLGVAVLSRGNPSLGYGAKTIQGVTARLLRRYNALAGGRKR